MHKNSGSTVDQYIFLIKQSSCIIFGFWPFVTSSLIFSQFWYWGRSYNTFYTFGWWKRKCLNCHWQTQRKRALGGIVLIIWPNIFWIKRCYRTLGSICKFVLKCRKYNRIGPWSLLGFRITWRVKLDSALSFSSFERNKNLFLSKTGLSIPANLIHLTLRRREANIF